MPGHPNGRAYSDRFAPLGAEALCKRIRKHWEREGYSVDVRAEPDPEHPGIVVIRSDMINGYPVGFRSKEAA